MTFSNKLRNIERSCSRDYDSQGKETKQEKHRAGPGQQKEELQTGTILIARETLRILQVN